MDDLKIKSILTKDGTACKVEVIKKVGEPEKDSYGNLKTPYDVKVNDKELMRFDASETQVKGMKEVGCNPFVIKRWDKGDRTGFNFLEPNDINAQEQNCEPSISSAQIEKKVQAGKDDYGDKASRGAAWNNAWQLLVKRLDGDELEKACFDHDFMNAFCERVANKAERIAPHQKAFVSNIKEREDCPKEAIEHVEKPKDSDYIQEEVKVDDLPF